MKLATQPIAWSNDDFHDLGGDTPLEQCLTEMKAAGFIGTELGHKYPRDKAALKLLLKENDLALASAWHSTYLLTNNIEEEKKSWNEHLDLLQYQGCKVAIAAECTNRIYNQSGVPLRSNQGPDCSNGLSEGEWNRLSTGLETLAALAENRNMKLAYHYHMGTVIQNLDEITTLMSRTSRTGLVLDTGHATFAGADPVWLAQKYADRIFHVHLKNVRWNILEVARSQKWSFEKAVREGVFTVPGDNEPNRGIDFVPILNILKKSNYKDWLVVEAEQDPKKANPFEFAKLARSYLKKEFGL